MNPLSPTALSLVATVLSTISIAMAALSLRRQGIPDRFEVRRRAMESIQQTNPDRRINGFEVVYISVKEEDGLWNTLKKYWSGRIQGRTQAFISLDRGAFDEDFEGEYEFESSFDRPMPVTVSAPAETQSQRLVTLQTTESQDVYGLLQWLLIDIFPEHVE
ncbi:hypothetical protein [Halostella salina]|uniref:hypothetical protein n=1 Tax=Halostella salina TaxID=1547897 RepID=UPI000EF7CBD7|nr:hypothetical protein [Halostella salina]